MDTRPIPDDAMVIRGGQMLSADLVRNAEAHHEEFPDDGFAISVFVGIGISAMDLAASIPLPQKTIRLTTAGKLRDAGFRLAYDDETTLHANLYLPEQPDEETFERLRSLFDGEVVNPNPAPRTRRENPKE
jgi:hypothetical protein